MEAGVEHRNDPLKNTGRDNYELEDTMYFSVRRVGNGHVVTLRVYSETKRAQNTNSYGSGPPYTDEIRVVPEGSSVLDMIGSLIVSHKVLNK